LSLEPLDLSSNLVDLGLDGGVRGDLHRGYKIQEEMGAVKTFFKLSLRLTATASSW
jgi:hypothetical protein